MICYHGALSGTSRSAVALCHDCGAALCPDHIIPDNTPCSSCEQRIITHRSNHLSGGSGARPARPPSTQPTTSLRHGGLTKR